MFDRPKSGERAVLVHVSSHTADPDALQEFTDLAESAGAEVLELLAVVRGRPDPKLFVGSGKAEEIQALVAAHEADLVIFDNTLSPSQERNLEKLFQCRVLDRTGLILDIFAQRARSFEGKLQVELAQLRHLSTRLVRGWTHLERQKGGIGLRGPGETQLETDRRLLNNRIDQIRRRLERVEGQREQGRRARRRAEVPTVALVGYTNAGKSTLFNALTEAGVYAQDQLFATLDPTLRRVALPDNSHMILADTVGFVSNLPHELVAAFKSTLQETAEATLLLHVVDAAGHRRDEQIHDVEAVLEQIGANAVPCIQVFNKIDLLEDTPPRVERNAAGQVTRVWLSASSGDGMAQLLEALAEHFRTASVRHLLRLTPRDGRLRALLFERAQVHGEAFTEEGGWELDVELPRRDFDQLLSREPHLKDAVVN
jgi:GTP-binding protein HflX